MRKVYVTLTGLLVISVVIQFYFAAFGVFTAPRNDSQFILHVTNGRFILPLLCLLCIAAAALAKAPGRLIGFTAIPFGLLVLQTVLFVIAGLIGSTPEKTTVAGRIILPAGSYQIGYAVRSNNATVFSLNLNDWSNLVYMVVNN